MADELEVANVALGMIGEPPVVSLAENVETARALNLRLPIARDAVLRSHFWNFAIRRSELTALPTAPAFGFDTQFNLPADWLRMAAVNPGQHGAHAITSQTDYAIEGDQLLIRGTDVARIIYVAREEDLTRWDALATEALAARLASELAVAVTQNRALGDQLQRLYRDKLAEARSVDAMDEPPKAIEANEWVASRFGTFPFLETLPPFEES